LKCGFKGWLLLGFCRRNSHCDQWKLEWDRCRISFVLPASSSRCRRDGVQEPAAEAGSFYLAPSSGRLRREVRKGDWSALKSHARTCQWARRGGRERACWVPAAPPRWLQSSGMSWQRMGARYGTRFVKQHLVSAAWAGAGRCQTPSPRAELHPPSGSRVGLCAGEVTSRRGVSPGEHGKDHKPKRLPVLLSLWAFYLPREGLQADSKGSVDLSTECRWRGARFNVCCVVRELSRGSILKQPFSGAEEGRAFGAVAGAMPGWIAGRRARQSCLSAACWALRDCLLLLLFPLIPGDC